MAISTHCKQPEKHFFLELLMTITAEQLRHLLILLHEPIAALTVITPKGEYKTPPFYVDFGTELPFDSDYSQLKYAYL